jgi:hypothetical protein
VLEINWSSVGTQAAVYLLGVAVAAVCAFGLVRLATRTPRRSDHNGDG